MLTVGKVVEEEREVFWRKLVSLIPLGGDALRLTKERAVARKADSDRATCHRRPRKSPVETENEEGREEERQCDFAPT